MIAQVRSGCQTGVDLAGVRAARRLGIPTGGVMPKGWKTQDGPHSEYADLYGMTESPFADYQRRTFQNAADAHATIRIAYDWNSAGEKCTLRAIHAADRPYFDIGLGEEMTHDPARVDKALVWLRGLGAGIILNIAGNSERTAPGIEVAAEEILFELFARAIGL